MSSTETLEETKTRLMPRYRVLLHNDDHNSFDHVIVTLINIFHFELKKALEVTLEAHHTGVALCVVEPLEHAELHRDQLNAASLSATIEPDD